MGRQAQKGGMDRVESAPSTGWQARAGMGGRRLIVLFAAVAISLALFGCTATQGGAANAASQNQSRPGSAANGTGFLVPESPVAYTAYYIVDEGGRQTEKMAYRMGRNMRVDYVDGNMTIGVFFLKDKAYSCTRMHSGGYGCFDITDEAALQGVSSLIGMPNLGDAELDEVVDIGSGGRMKAQCYIFTVPPFSGRKRCFADGGIPAYDEYALPGGQKHVEYLANIRLSASLQDFGLPVTPVVPPGNSSGIAVDWGG